MASTFQPDVFDVSVFEAATGFFLDAEIRLDKAFRINAALRRTSSSSFSINAVIKLHSFTVDAQICYRHFTLDACIGAFARISQAPLEVLVSPADQKARISQTPVEALVRPWDAYARVSQSVIEVLVQRTNGHVHFDAVIKANPSAGFTIRAAIGHGAGLTLDATFAPLRFSVDAIRSRAGVGSFPIAADLLFPTSKTFKTNAAIKKIGLSGSTTLDAVIALVPVPLFKLDAFVQPYFYINAHLDLGFHVDALVLHRFTQGITVNADIFGTPQKTFTIRAVIRRSFAGSFTLDAETVPAHFKIDAIKGQTTASGFVVNAQVGGGGSFFLISAVILATAGPGLRPLTFPGTSRTPGGLTVNALSPAFPISIGEQAVVVVDSPPSDGGDLSIAGALTGYPVSTDPGEHDVLAVPGVYYVASFKGNVYRPTLTGAGSYKDWSTGLQFTIGAFIQPRFTIDARFVWTFGSTFAVAATLRRRQVAAFAISAFIRPTFRIDARIASRHFSIDAWIKCEFTLDAWLSRSGTRSLAFTVGAWFTHPVFGFFSISAWVQPHFELGASKVITYYRHDDRGIHLDAWKISGINSSFTLDARIRPHFTINAVIVGRSAWTFNVDAYVSNAKLGSFTVAAFIEGAFRLDATLLRVTPGLVHLDSAIVRRPQGSFTINASITGFLINAVIKGRQQAFFSIFAYKTNKWKRGGSFAIFAEKYDASAYWDQYWEQWFHPHFYIDALKMIHRSGSFPVGAAIILPGQPITSWFIDSAIVATGTGDFLLEAFIRAERTVVYEGEGEIVSVLENVSKLLDFPGATMVLPDGAAGDNVLSGPFWPPAFQPGTITIWGEINDPNVSIGIDSANENLWANPYVVNHGPGQITVVRGSTTTITFWPAYYFEPHYVYAWTDGVYKPSMTGSGMLTYSQQIDRVLSYPAPTLDAWIVGTLGEPFTIDAEIVSREKLGTFSVDAEMSAQSEHRGAIGLDASIRGQGGAFFSIFAKIAARAFTLDACFYQIHFTADAFIQPYLHLDAAIARGGAGSFTVNAWKLRTTKIASFVVGAEIAAAGDRRGSLTLNALVLGEKLGQRIYLAANIVMAPASFALNAMIAPWFGVDAWISPVGGGLGAVTVDAYVRGSSYIIFPKDGGTPTDPLGNPPALTRKFAVKIEAGFANPLPTADPVLVTSIQDQLVVLQSELTTTTDPDRIRDLNSEIAFLTKELSVAMHRDPVEFWWDAAGRMSLYLDTYEALKHPTPEQTAAYQIDLATYEYDVMRFRMTRDPAKTWVEITGDCIWGGTDFTQMAKTGPGNFTITLKGAHPEFIGGEEIHFEIDGLRVFGGYTMDVERGYFFSDFAHPKTVLHGTDYNILLDRLRLRNWRWEFSNHGKTNANAGPYRSWPAFKKGTMDDDMIKRVFGDYVAPDLPMDFDFTTGVDAIVTPAPDSPWVMPDPGSTLRVFLQSISQITSGVWCTDAYKVLQYHDRETITAPYPLTDGLGGISSRGLSVNTDISQMINDVLVWGTLGKTVEGEIMVTHELGDGHWRERLWLEAISTVQGYVSELASVSSPTKSQTSELKMYRSRLVAYKKNLAAARANPEASSIDQYGRWQYAEFRQDIFHQRWLDIRARAILLRWDDPIRRATATVWDPGYQAGQVVNVKSSVYGIDVNLPIRQSHISFTVAKEPVGQIYYALPRYDLEMGIDPESPWNIYDFLPYPGSSTPGLGMDTTGG